MEIYIFKKESWPQSKFIAEKIGKKEGFDTLICLNKNYKFSGRAKNGIWCLGIIGDYFNLFNCVTYENKYNRKAIIWAEDYEFAFKLFCELKNNFDEPKLDLNKYKFLCHSTTIESFIEILKDNKILSYNQLINRGKKINTVRFQLNEPTDFYDYIDFCNCESIASEIVVASRQFEKINDNIKLRYKPGVRMYFDFKNLSNIRDKCFDGLHDFRIFKELHINYIKAIIFSSKEDVNIVKSKVKIEPNIQEKILYLNDKRYWEPEEFVNKANNLVYTRYINRGI
ncbi:hypothetical protein UT300019_21700 [Clostridium sp. CTA-19]